MIYSLIWCWRLLLPIQAFIATVAWVHPPSSTLNFRNPYSAMTKHGIKTKMFLSKSSSPQSNDAGVSSSKSNETVASNTDEPLKNNDLTSSASIPSSPTDGTRNIKESRPDQGPSSAQLLAALGTSPRRLTLSFMSATGIALAANFLGMTSALLNLLPEDVVESSSLDTFYPRGDYKRYKTDLYTFVIPKQWVADTSLELAKAQRRAATLDYRMRQYNRGGVSQLPDAAFGPAGNTKGDTNVSVLRSNIPLGSFSALKATILDTEPEKYLNNLLAPEGSGRTVTLIDAREVRANTFQFEYFVELGGESLTKLHAISVIAAPNDQLLTLTVVSPAEHWTGGESEMEFRKIASSFHTL